MQSELDVATAEMERAQQRILALEQEKALRTEQVTGFLTLKKKRIGKRIPDRRQLFT